MKKVKGFTLIELIVVIAIIAVLAAILVPAIMGWVKKSQIATANSNASELCDSFQTTITDLDTEGHDVPDMQVTYNGSTITFSASVDTEVQKRITMINNSLTDLSKSKWAAQINDKEVSSIVFTNDDYHIVGGFPIPCPVDSSYIMRNTFGINDFLSCASGNDTWASKR